MDQIVLSYRSKESTLNLNRQTNKSYAEKDSVTATAIMAAGASDQGEPLLVKEKPKLNIYEDGDSAHVGRELSPLAGSKLTNSINTNKYLHLTFAYASLKHPFSKSNDLHHKGKSFVKPSQIHSRQPTDGHQQVTNSGEFNLPS
jgi:hypothetical protein